MTDPFRLLMIGAMYENGGNTTHRYLDGHPELYVYPFESQVGTRYVDDALSSMFPAKYRWPQFHLDASAVEDYAAIIDEETKVRARTPHVSKFRGVEFDFSDDQRRQRYLDIIESAGRGRGSNVAAFFQATFDVWRNHAGSGREKVYVGYSPIISVDAGRILRDLPDAHILHVVRNPWSAYADTKKRPVPMSLESYMQAWTVNQAAALTAVRRWPDRVHIVRVEDVLEDAHAALGPVLRALDLSDDPALDRPSWNGAALAQVYPWGTIRHASPRANLETAAELNDIEAGLIGELAWQYTEHYGYGGFSR